MVAAHVGMTPSGNSLVARSTTFMPNQRGLGALLTMIFAPQVELRCDARNKRSVHFKVDPLHNRRNIRRRCKKSVRIME